MTLTLIILGLAILYLARAGWSELKLIFEEYDMTFAPATRADLPRQASRSWLPGGRFTHPDAGLPVLHLNRRGNPVEDAFDYGAQRLELVFPKGRQASGEGQNNSGFRSCVHVFEHEPGDLSCVTNSMSGATK